MPITKIKSPELFDFSDLNTALQLPTGTTAERPATASTGEWRYNTTLKYVEYYDGGGWRQIDTDAPYDGTTYLSMIEYAGDNSTDRDITGVGFDPDLTIVKNKGAGESWGWGDTVRGGGYIIYSNLTNGQTASAYVTPSAVTDGFKISTGNNNYVGNNYIAYNFKAGGAATNITSSSTGVSAASRSANTTSGFSIVTYTMSSTTVAIPHGLSSTPKLAIVKKTNSTSDWFWYNTVVPGKGRGYFPSAGVFDNSGVPTFGATDLSFQDSDPFSSGSAVVYFFADVAGAQQVGVYTGQGTSTATVNTGFSPRFLIIKNTDGTNSWVVFDSSRQTSNPREALFLDASAGQAGGYGLNFLSTGFEVTANVGEVNTLNDVYTYLAIA